jgi:cell division protein FtsB
VKHAALENKHPRHERFLSRLNKILIVLTIGAAAIPLSYRAMPGVKEKAAQDEALAALDSQLDEARMLNKRLAGEVNMLRNDPEYLGLFARDLVDPGYMEPGETIFRLTPAPR